MMSRLEPKHWLVIAGFITATASVVGGLYHWHDLLKPAVVAGLMGQVSTLLTALFVGAPPNPNLNPLVNPRRRADDPEPELPLGTVSDSTRRNL